MRENEYINSLVSEYTSLLDRRLAKDSQSQYDKTGIIEDLAASADWSISGAQELVRMVENYGAFMLRNALAIAVVLGREDGAQGF